MIDRCFKTGGRCAVDNLEELHDQVFVGIPFKPPYTDLFEYGVRPALLELGLSPWIAMEHPGVGDLLCKICQGLQSSSAAIIDISFVAPDKGRRREKGCSRGDVSLELRRQAETQREPCGVHGNGLGVNASDARKLPAHIESLVPADLHCHPGNRA